MQLWPIQALLMTLCILMVIIRYLNLDQTTARFLLKQKKTFVIKLDLFRGGWRGGGLWGRVKAGHRGSVGRSGPGQRLELSRIRTLWQTDP